MPADPMTVDTSQPPADSADLATRLSDLAYANTMNDYLVCAQQFGAYLNTTDPATYTPAERAAITAALDEITRRITCLYLRLDPTPSQCRPGTYSRTMHDMAAAVCWILTRTGSNGHHYLSDEARSRLILISVTA